MNNIPITYRKLLSRLQELTPEQLDKSVSVRNNDEFFPVFDTILSDEILDDGDAIDMVGEDQPVLICDLKLEA